MTGPLTLLTCLAVAGSFIGFGFMVGRHYERMFPQPAFPPHPNRHPSFHHRPARSTRTRHTNPSLRLVRSVFDFEEGA